MTLAHLSRPNLCRALVFAALAAVVLTGCGRRGDLVAPSAAAVKEAPAGQPAKPANPPPPDRPFVLDPLLR